jgi:putative ABC transport system ATP-binding protein
MNQIKMKDIKKKYTPRYSRAIQALNGLDLTIHKGEMVAIRGRSGSGKSTLLHIIGCIDRPTSGEYWVNSIKVHDAKDSWLSQCRCRTFGFVLQQFGLIPERRAWENVSLPLIFSNSNIGMKQRCFSALERVGLESIGDRRTADLSGGEQQRVAIARAMVNNPDVILADEPTGNLDTQNSKLVMELFVSMHLLGKTIIIVTHDNAVANQCKRVVTLSDGQIISEEYNT